MPTNIHAIHALFEARTPRNVARFLAVPALVAASLHTSLRFSAGYDVLPDGFAAALHGFLLVSVSRRNASYAGYVHVSADIA